MKICLFRLLLIPESRWTDWRGIEVDQQNIRGKSSRYIKLYLGHSMTKTNKTAVYPTKTDQPWHQPSLVEVFAVRMKNAWVLSYSISAKWWVSIGKKIQRIIVNIILSISFNICFGCSKEPSQWDGSFEYQQHMFWLRNKKTNFWLHTLIWRPESEHSNQTRRMPRLILVFAHFVVFVVRWLIYLMGSKGNNINFITF